eukprot:294449-Heterocapsa_arctica.AAC.1
MGRVFEAHKKLGMRGADGRGEVRKSVPNPEKEREAWKEHFETIQRGREQVEEKVWDNVTRKERADWLDKPPRDAEIEKCMRKMKNGKAAGADSFVAEFIRYGGPILKKSVCNVVRRMWGHALESKVGEE